MRIERFGARHVRRDFACGRPELDRYIRELAGQDERRDVATVFVMTDDGSDVVVGYYTLSSFTVVLQDLPEELARRLPRYPNVPATLLGRLAVAESRQGEGLGETLLVDALERAAAVSEEVASAAVVVDAADEDAARFYERFGFLSLPRRPARLFLPMATVRRALGE